MEVLEVGDVIFNETQGHLSKAKDETLKAHKAEERLKARVEKWESLSVMWNERFEKEEKEKAMIEAWPEELKKSFNKLYQTGLNHDFQKRSEMEPFKDNKEELEKRFKKTAISMWLVSDDVLKKSNYRVALKSIMESLEKLKGITGDVKEWCLKFSDEKGLSGTAAGDKGVAVIRGSARGSFRVKDASRKKDSKDDSNEVKDSENPVSNENVTNEQESRESSDSTYVEENNSTTEESTPEAVSDEEKADVNVMPF